MNQLSPGFIVLSAALTMGPATFFPLGSQAQTTPKSDQWIHVRVESKDEGETARVNLPVEMAVKVLPAIKHEPLHEGKIHIKAEELNEVDLHAVLEAVRSSRDAEFVTVQGDGNDVRIAKNGGYLYVHVIDNNPHHRAKHPQSKEAPAKAPSAKESKVEIKIPMKVVDALLSAGKDELDLVAALRALSANGDTTELVSIKDDENNIRIWIDSKSVAD